MRVHGQSVSPSVLQLLKCCKYLHLNSLNRFIRFIESPIQLSRNKLTSRMPHLAVWVVTAADPRKTNSVLLFCCNNGQVLHRLELKRNVLNEKKFQQKLNFVWTHSVT